MRRVLVSVTLLLILLGGAVFGWNYLAVGRPLVQALDRDDRNVGISARAHFGSYVNSSIIVFDLRSVSSQNSPMDVFRALLQFAAAVKDNRYSRVQLAHRGRTKFILTGAYFAQLGAEYGDQNPTYTLRTFPEHLYRPDGAPAYATWTGGVLGVLNKQMEDFNDFHRKWYIDDLIPK